MTSWNSCRSARQNRAKPLCRVALSSARVIAIGLHLNATPVPGAALSYPPRAVDQLETTRAHGLVSNLSASYNRSCGRERPALQLDDHLKNLLRELGHAINDTVSESDRITGAIAGVRAHGYDIVLKLDATIGLARRDAASQDSRLTTLDRR